MDFSGNIGSTPVNICEMKKPPNANWLLFRKKDLHPARLADRGLSESRVHGKKSFRHPKTPISKSSNRSLHYHSRVYQRYSNIDGVFDLP